MIINGGTAHWMVHNKKSYQNVRLGGYPYFRKNPHVVVHKFIKTVVHICQCLKVMFNGEKPCLSKWGQHFLPNHSHESKTFVISLALPRSNPMNGSNNRSQYQAFTELPERHWCTKYNPPHVCLSCGEGNFYLNNI